MADPDPYPIVSDLIVNAIATARVCGENHRINNLIAGSVARFMADMDDGGALLAHALACIDGEDTVPKLRAQLHALAPRSA